MSKQKSLGDLVSDAETLLSKLGDLESPDIQALRDKVEAGVAEAKKTLSRQAQAGADRLQEVTESVVAYVRKNPWVAVAGGTAIAVALLYIAFSGSSSEED